MVRVGMIKIFEVVTAQSGYVTIFILRNQLHIVLELLPNPLQFIFISVDH